MRRRGRQQLAGRSRGEPHGHQTRPSSQLTSVSGGDERHRESSGKRSPGIEECETVERSGYCPPVDYAGYRDGRTALSENQGLLRTQLNTLLRALRSKEGDVDVEHEAA